MKLAVITDEISMDFEHALDVMLEYGVRGAELRSLWDTNIGDLTDEQASNAKAALDARGISVCCLASPFFKCDLGHGQGGETGRTHQATERGFDQQMQLLSRCIELCHLFGTSLIRVFSFWKRGDLTEDVEEQIVRALREPVSRAAEAGVVLGLENEHACYLGTGEETGRVLRAVNSPALKCVWDPGNAFCAGEQPFPDGYQAVRDYVVHVHIKDPVATPEGHEFVRVGDGDIDYPAQLRALKADGYEGFLSLETHYRPSGDSELGSRQCLETLEEMLAAL